MSNNLYRTILGVALLASFYLEVNEVVYALIAMVLFEGITNLRIPKIINNIRKVEISGADISSPHNSTRFSLEAERMFRILVGTILALSYPLGPESMFWFVPWFMGFAILGAGVSGICPALATLKWLGFR